MASMERDDPPTLPITSRIRNSVRTKVTRTPAADPAGTKSDQWRDVVLKQRELYQYQWNKSFMTYFKSILTPKIMGIGRQKRYHQGLQTAVTAAVITRPRNGVGHTLRPHSLQPVEHSIIRRQTQNHLCRCGLGWLRGAVPSGFNVQPRLFVVNITGGLTGARAGHRLHDHGAGFGPGFQRRVPCRIAGWPAGVLRSEGKGARLRFVPDGPYL